jgi:acyl-coenzyme A synthetase/AMP-(fatty) acid ligase
VQQPAVPFEWLRLRQLLETRLPADVVFVEALPKTSVGKIAQRELREQFKDHRWPDT